MTAVIDPEMIHRESWWIEGLYKDANGYVFDGEMDADTFGEALVDNGRNNGPVMLYDLVCQGALNILDHPGVVADAWSSDEYPARNFGVEPWVELFGDAGYTHDGRPAPRPTEPITLYRGCVPAYRFGMSWTTEVATARRFAGELLGRLPGNVYVHRAQPIELLAYIHTEIGRGEAEYVIDPFLLNDDNVHAIETAI